MQRFRRTAVVTCVAALLFASCDSVVLAFNPNPSGPPTVDGLAIIQVPPAGGDIRGTAPQVRATYPKATGWPLSVPVVIEFSQSMNEASIFPTSATVNDAKVIVRVKGTTQALPAQYNFIGGGRLLVIRPAGLSAQNSQSYETVILPGVRDVDGVRYNVTTESILAEFTPDAVSTDVDGQILAVYPRDRQTEIPRETGSIVIFTRAATASTLTASNLRLTDTAGAAVATNITLPLTTLGQSDSRVVQLQPPTPLSGNAEYPASRHGGDHIWSDRSFAVQQSHAICILSDLRSASRYGGVRCQSDHWVPGQDQPQQLQHPQGQCGGARRCFSGGPRGGQNLWWRQGHRGDQRHHLRRTQCESDGCRSLYGERGF